MNPARVLELRRQLRAWYEALPVLTTQRSGGVWLWMDAGGSVLGVGLTPDEARNSAFEDWLDCWSLDEAPHLPADTSAEDVMRRCAFVNGARPCVVQGADEDVITLLATSAPLPLLLRALERRQAA